MTRRFADGLARAWLVVALVGVIVVALVFALGLFPRLNSGQDLLDDARPAFTEQRVAGDRAGVGMVSKIVDLADPIVTARGGAAAEVPELVAFVSKRTGLSAGQVLAALRENFPRTLALLQAIPLNKVTAEIPKLVGFLSDTLRLSEDEVRAALEKSFPRLSQSITALPAVTRGWNRVPGTADLTRFDGRPVRTVPEVRDYLSGDVIPVLERQQQHFQDADELKVDAIPWLLLVIGIGVIGFGIVMALNVNARGLPIAWVVVAAAGAIVLGLVVGVLQSYPRLNAADDLLDDARPAFSEQRVAGDRAGIAMVSKIVDLADPIATTRGGAAGEVPKLVRFVSRETGLPAAAVLAKLRQGFPHTTALLQAIPLSAVARELPRLRQFLGTTLNVSGAELDATLERSFPGLAQSIANLPPVTRGWNRVPGTAELTRFNGRPVRTVPEMRNYLSGDVIPVLERQQQHFQDLDDPFPRLNVFPPLLSTVAAVVILYGLLWTLVCSRRDGLFPARASGRPRVTSG